MLDFKFAAKFLRVITHEKEFENALEDMKKFLDLMLPMQKIGRLGALLIQLPNFKEDSEKSLESFLQILPFDFIFAIEFLDKS